MTDREQIGCCEECSKPFYEGDKVQFGGDGIAFCEEHAASLSEIIESWKRNRDSSEPYWPEVFDTAEEVEEHIASLRARLQREGDIKPLQEA